jgi:hypothetical protein
VLPTAQASRTIFKKERLNYYLFLLIIYKTFKMANYTLKKWNLSISQRTKQSYLAFNSNTTLGQDYKLRDQINGSSGIMDMLRVLAWRKQRIYTFLSYSRGSCCETKATITANLRQKTYQRRKTIC